MDEAFFPWDDFVMHVAAPSNWPDYCEMLKSSHKKGEYCGAGSLP